MTPTQSSDKLKAAAGKAITASGEQQPSIRQWVEHQKDQITRALGGNPRLGDQFVRACLTEISKTPRLGDCTPQSMLGAIMACAHLGLEPGPMKLVALIPFENKKKTRTFGYPIFEVTLIVQYRGFIELALRSGLVSSIEARVVYNGDFFDFAYGLNPRLEHSFDGDKPRTTADQDIRYFYGIARPTNGGLPYFLVMTKAEVDKFRARGRASDDGPWVTDYAAMGMKTVIRRMEPFLAKSTEMAQAFATDGHTVLNVSGEQIIEEVPDEEEAEDEVGADGSPITDAETVEPNVQQGEVVIPPAAESRQMTQDEVREAEAIAAQDDAPFES